MSIPNPASSVSKFGKGAAWTVFSWLAIAAAIISTARQAWSGGDWWLIDTLEWMWMWVTRATEAIQT